MNRTYNFQVDNGLFVAENYIGKDYKDININDLEDNIERFAKKMCKYGELGTLKSTSHNNSALTQPAFKNNRVEKVSEQLKELIDNISNHKTCMICGENKVNVEYEVNSAFMAMIPSLNKFSNKANNLHTIDVCPVCLFLSYISFLNTQKISFPFLYLSDSDNFMREITDEIQKDVSRDILTDRKIKDSDNYFLEIMQRISRVKRRYGDMTYIDLIYFANAQNNYYNIQNINRQKLSFINSLKKNILIKEFCELNLFQSYIRDRISIKNLISNDNKQIYKLICSGELYKLLESEIMTNKDIEIVEYATEKLLENNSVDDLLKELKICNMKNDFEKFIINHSKEKLLYRTLLEYKDLTNIYKYKNLLIANLLLNR